MKIRRRFRSVSAVLAFTLATAPVMTALAPNVGADSSYPLHVIGSVPMPIGPVKSPTAQAKVLGVDPVRRKMFYLYGDVDGKAHIVTYDISKRVPRQLTSAPAGAFSDYGLATRYTVAYDSKRQQLAILVAPSDPTQSSVPHGLPSLVVFSDVKHAIVATWNIAMTVPGYFPLGVSYSAKDDRYYSVGEFTATKNAADGTPVAGSKFISPGSGVVSLDATTGALKWVRSVAHECPQVLYSFHIGSLIAQSGVTESLYFACVSGGTPGGQTYPGTTGLVRLHIDPKGSSADQLNQEVEYFAISGNYFSGGDAVGIAAFDAVHERFYLQSLSFTTPGDWVFDGNLTAWVGFVTAPNNADYYNGINQRMGHLYVGTYRSGKGNVNGVQVADVNQTPVPNGEVSALVTTALMFADDGSNRLFVRPINSNAMWLVVEDLAPVTTPGDTNEDYDAQTSALADEPANDIDYAIGATGFGAEAVQVGGTGAPETTIGSSGQGGIPGVSASTRATMSARIGGIDLRPGGAAAGAQAFTADTGTMQEYETNHGKWPYEAVTCLDAGGSPDSKTAKNPSDVSGAGSHASISCNLAKNEVHATAQMSGALGAMKAQDASYDVTATRDTAKGAYVHTEATARGVTFTVEGGFVIHFGRVVSTTTSLAHGHAGTSYTEWTRDVEGVRVTNPLGQDIPVLGGCSSHVKLGPALGAHNQGDNCADLAKSLNGILPTRFHADFPMPSVIATPKGAFSAVEQTDAQYLQQTWTNDQGIVYRDDSVGIRPAPAVITEAYTDTAERSRTVTVLAATQSNAKFTISPPYDDGFVDGGGTSGGTGGTTGTTTPVVTPGTTTKVPSGTTPTINQPPQTVAGNPVTELRGFLLLRRSLRDTALLVLLSGLMLGGCGTAWRRRRLVDVLVTVPRKEAAL
jgi:hypothetical protein